MTETLAIDVVQEAGGAAASKRPVVREPVGRQIWRIIETLRLSGRRTYNCSEISQKSVPAPLCHISNKNRAVAMRSRGLHN